MLHRLLFILTIAISMAAVPFAMPMGEAMAAAPMHHGEVKAAAHDTGHCSGDEQQQSPDDAGKPCCVAGCFALATLDAPAAGEALLLARIERPAPDRFRRGTLSEIATPPPRTA